MFFAVVSFTIYLFFLVLLAWFALKATRPTLIGFVLIASILTVFRQLIFFAGLDVPSPQGYFAPTEWQLITEANLACTFWLFIVVLSYGVSSKIAPALSGWLPSGPPPKSKNEKITGLALVVFMPAAFAVVGTLYLILQSGGIAQFMYAEKIGKELKGLAIFKEATTLSAILALYGFIVNLKFAETGKTKLSRASFGYLAVIISVMMANYAWGNRYNIALTFILFGLVWHYYVSALSIFKVALWSLLAMLGLQFLSVLRGELVSSAVGREYQVVENPWTSISASLHFIEFDAFLLALRDTGHLFDFRMGQDFINGLLSWVPRSIYPDKETFNIGPWFRRIYQPEKINGWPVTTMGSWYVNFGYFGIFFGAIISGFVMRLIDAAYTNIRNNPWHAAIGFGVCLFMLETGLNTGFPQKIILLIVPLSWASYWLRTHNRKPQTKYRPDNHIEDSSFDRIAAK